MLQARCVVWRNWAGTHTLPLGSDTSLSELQHNVQSISA